ncbi:MAG: hypothetical protein U0904_03745 [Candidatus Nanopelagicales bacterium]|nr:hypothetical protein [Candidatus Nanopelagicales bacterium]
MRLEDHLIRQTQANSRFVDLRPEDRRHSMSLSIEEAREVLVAAAPPEDLSERDVLIVLADQLDDADEWLSAIPADKWPDLAVVLPGRPGAVDVPSVLAWVSRHDCQLTHLAGIQVPSGVLAFVSATQHAIPPLESTDERATWRRLAGELLFERFRASAQEERAVMAENAASAATLQLAQSDRKLKASTAKVDRLTAKLAAARVRRERLQQRVEHLSAKNQELGSRTTVRVGSAVRSRLRRGGAD